MFTSALQTDTKSMRGKQYPPLTFISRPARLEDDH